MIAWLNLVARMVRLLPGVEMPHGYYPLMWLFQGFSLFIAFTVQGAMWSGAQQDNRNGWVIALIWAVATLVLMEGSHAFHDGLFPHGD